MTNPTSGPQRTQQHARRLDWLRAHPDLLARLPGAGDDVEPAQSEALDEALRALQLVQLYATSGQNASIRDGIRLLVSELRGQHVGKKGSAYGPR